jgi:hypothetical protein
VTTGPLARPPIRQAIHPQRSCLKMIIVLHCIPPLAAIPSCCCNTAQGLQVLNAWPCIFCLTTSLHRSLLMLRPHEAAVCSQHGLPATYATAPCPPHFMRRIQSTTPAHCHRTVISSSRHPLTIHHSLPVPSSPHRPCDASMLPGRLWRRCMTVL